MANGLNSLFQFFQSSLTRKGDRSLLPPLPRGRVPAEMDAPSDAAQPGGKAAENDPPKSHPIEINIESTRCDLHPLYVLRPVTIQVTPPGSDTPVQLRAVQCPKEGCDRHYLPEYGYFPFTAGVDSKISDVTAKIPCTVHEHSYMAVAKAGGNFAWACLQAGCRQTAPYQSL